MRRLDDPALRPRSRDYDIEAFRAAYRKLLVPRWYRGWMHLGFTVGLLGAVLAVALPWMIGAGAWPWLTLAVTLVLGNLTVYVVHRYPLHRRLPGMGAAYDAHTRLHHFFFTYEHNECTARRDFHILLFPPEIVASVALGVAPLGGLTLGWLAGAAHGAAFAAGAAIYFALYEVFHSISHLGDQAVVLRMPLLGPWFRAMREHHRRHHHLGLMGRYNFNIVAPLGDWLAGTVYRGPWPPGRAGAGLDVDPRAAGD
jgi:hypothetical protein